MKYILKLCYRGPGFHGFQRQPADRTVQGELEKALQKLFKEPITLAAAGRTDTGVHALGQIVSFTTERALPLKAAVDGTNGLLSHDLAVVQGAMLDTDHSFHPRYSAQSRTYHYYVLSSTAPQDRVIHSGHVWCIGPDLQKTAMEEAARHLLGRHDFATFTSRNDKPTTIREILALSISEHPAPPWTTGKLWRFELTANAFLRKMVRMLTASLVEVGLGLRAPQDVKKMREALDPSAGPHPAPGEGLYFHSVAYPEDPFALGESYRARIPAGFIFKR